MIHDYYDCATFKNYKERILQAAGELHYGPEVVKKVQAAKAKSEIRHIMTSARNQAREVARKRKYERNCTNCLKQNCKLLCKDGAGAVVWTNCPSFAKGDLADRGRAIRAAIAMKKEGDTDERGNNAESREQTS